MSWFLAPALAKLRSQLDLFYQTRDRTSDGSIGDRAHAARKSDHNPDPDGMVRALDVDRDIAKGFTARDLAESIVAARDPRFTYIISRGQIASGKDGPAPWQWRKYSGVNGHFEHAHFSVSRSGGRIVTPWAMNSGSTPHPLPVTPAKPSGDVPKIIVSPDRVRPVLRLGDAGADVAYLQRMLGGLTADGDFGLATRLRVVRFQRLHNLEATGETGAEFWHRLEE